MTKRFLVALAVAAVLFVGGGTSEAKIWNLRFTGSDFEAHPSSGQRPHSLVQGN